LPVTPQVDERCQIREGGYPVGDAVDFGGFKGPRARVPMGAWVRGEDRKKGSVEREGREVGYFRMPFVSLVVYYFERPIRKRERGNLPNSCFIA
jgi:hypothetical protein